MWVLSYRVFLNLTTLNTESTQSQHTDSLFWQRERKGNCQETHSKQLPFPSGRYDSQSSVTPLSARQSFKTQRSPSSTVTLYSSPPSSVLHLSVLSCLISLSSLCSVHTKCLVVRRSRGRLQLTLCIRMQMLLKWTLKIMSHPTARVGSLGKVQPLLYRTKKLKLWIISVLQLDYVESLSVSVCVCMCVVCVHEWSVARDLQGRDIDRG